MLMPVAAGWYADCAAIRCALVGPNGCVASARRARVCVGSERQLPDPQRSGSVRVVGSKKVGEELLLIVVEDKQCPLMLGLLDHVGEVADDARLNELALDDVDHDLSKPFTALNCHDECSICKPAHGRSQVNGVPASRTVCDPLVRDSHLNESESRVERGIDERSAGVEMDFSADWAGVLGRGLRACARRAVVGSDLLLR